MTAHGELCLTGDSFPTTLENSWDSRTGTCLLGDSDFVVCLGLDYFVRGTSAMPGQGYVT